MRTLPKDFFFGAAFSGPQTEGAYKLDGKLENIWDTWSDERIGDFYNQVGSYVGNDFYHRYESDIQRLKSLGLTSFRTSIQWSRLLDQDGKINPEGAAFYHKLLACAKENGMEVFINLYHFDMPTYLFRRGGWESREVVEAYAHYAEQAFTEFAGEVKYWFTFNEPIVDPEQRYREGFFGILSFRISGARLLRSTTLRWRTALLPLHSVACKNPALSRQMLRSA